MWFQHPVVLIWEDKELSRYATHARGVECSKALVCVDAIVLLTMYAEDRRVPLIHKAVRTVLVCALRGFRRVLVPISVVILPVAEPSLLRVLVNLL